MRPRLLSQIYLPALFCLAALLAFSNNLNSYFLSDDFAQIGKVLHGDFSVAWGQAHGGFFRPLFILSYIVDTRIWHDRPFGFHLTNVLIHALNSFLVFRFGQLIFRDPKLPLKSINAAAAAGAVFFLLHPSHTEAVTWISGRADLLATFFCLTSLWCYCGFVKSRQPLNLICALALSVAALLAKESAICMPFLILIVGLYLSRGRKVLLEFGAFMMALLAFIAVRASFLGALVGGYGVGQHLNFAPGWIRDRLLEALARSALPALPAAWSWFLFKPLQSPLFIVIAVTSLGLFVTAIILRRRHYDRLSRASQNRLLLVLAGLFLFALLPVINLRLSLYETQGERFLYLPTVFSCLLISYGLIILARNPKLWLLIVIAALGLYSWRLYAANRIWREAAHLTRSIKDDLTTQALPTRLIVLNAPDNLRGVPVFHNGLPEALQLFQPPTNVEQVQIVSFQRLQAVWDENEFHQDGDMLMLRPFNHLDTFDRPSSTDCLELLGQSADSLKFTRRACLSPGEVYLFSGGKMRTALKRQSE